MPNLNYSRSPKVQKGAIVQLIDTLAIPIPNIVPFQFNPTTVTRRLKPWNPLEVDETHRGLPTPTAQPFDPDETITMEIELDASDQLEDDDPIAKQFGIGDRIAALEQMLLSGQSPLGQAVALASSLLSGSSPPPRPTVPVTFLVWGLGRIVPVRITSYSIEEQMFLPSLRPLQARVGLEMHVLTPESFKCVGGLAVGMAKTAYTFYRGQQDVLAVLNARNARNALLAILPF